MSTKLHIVKVQMPLMTNEPVPKALLYNRSRTFEVFMEAHKLKDRMKGEPKKFFYVKFKKKGFDLQGEAPWQDW